METIRLDSKEAIEEAVVRAKAVIENGGLIIYPTDTVYGIGVDATNKDAVSKVFDLKGREDKKPLSVIMKDLEMVLYYTEISDLADRTLKRLLPGPFTFLLPKKNNELDTVVFDKQDVGVRIPNSYFCVRLAQSLEVPYTTTSANKSGMGNPTSIDQVLEQFEGDHDLIDLIIDADRLETSEPSTIIKVESDGIQIIREGAKNTHIFDAVTKVDQEEL